jgi:hypothetical protein
MASRTALLLSPALAVVGMVLLLNWIDAGPGLAAVGLMTVAVVGGALFGVFADRLPVLVPARRRGRLVPRHVDRPSS